MQTARTSDRYIISRENNVVRVDFDRNPEPPNPQFPGAGALRSACEYSFDVESRRPWCRSAGLLAKAVGR
jgi:hypothetical protein